MKSATKEASKRLEAAFRLQPSAALRFQLIVNLIEIGDLQRATHYVEDGLADDPQDFELVNAYGVIVKRQGRYQEALDYFKRAEQLDSENISPQVNLGNTYMLLDAPQKAMPHFMKATQIEPGNGEYHRLLASAHSAMQDYGAALSLLQRAMQLSPRDPRIQFDINAIYFLTKDYKRALQETDAALVHFPKDLNFARMKGMILRQLGQRSQALQVYEIILQAFPNEVGTLVALGNLYQYDFDDRERANECYAKALAVNPGSIEAASQYCECLRNSRYGSEAAHLEKAYEIARNLLDKVPNPLKIAHITQNIFLRNVDYESIARLGERKKLLQYWVDRMYIAQLHNQLGRVETLEDRLDLVHYHRAWGKKVEEVASRHSLVSAPAVRIRNKIRVGIMSSDLRHHPVTYFVHPLLEQYNRSAFEFYCYSFYPREADGVQQRLSKIVDKFTVYPNLPDREIAQKITEDELDILFELGGTTYMNKLEVMAYRPAPVQISWLGYPHSAGLSAIDYILVDPYLKPERPDLLIEKPFTMPETWVSLGSLGFYDIPIEPGLPQERQGYLTFGTANSPYKFTAQLLETWARIMREVDGSRFLFVRPEGAVKYFRENLLRHFAQHGINENRIEFAPVRGAHMPYYNRIDIALDPFPHTGGTNTCEALWMGVPLVTLAGAAFFERISYSNLNNAGLGELCAFTIDSYVEKIIALAKDMERRRELRHSLRQQLRERPLGQTERFVRNFETKIKEVLGRT